MHSKLKRLLCILLCVTMIIPLNVSSLTIQEVKDKQAEIANRKQELSAQLDKLKNDTANLEAYQEKLQEKIEITQDGIESAKDSIEILDASILDLQNKLEQSAQKYQSTMDQLKKRFIAIYTQGETTTLEILLNSKSLYDFSLRTTALQIATDNDKKLMDDIKLYIDETKNDRTILNDQKTQVADMKKQLELDIEEINNLSDENLKVIESLNLQKDATLMNLDYLSEQDKEYQAELEKLLEEERQKEEANKLPPASSGGSSSGGSSSGGSSSGGSSSGGSSSGGSSSGGSSSGSGSLESGFNPLWPVPGYGVYWHYDPSQGHYGMDIAAPYGTPILASQSGKVISAEFHSSWGYNVFLYHNGSYSTRYAHMSRMAVSPGDYVEKGQIIGYIGSTGYSFGYHLHFEVYEGGGNNRVNPYYFF